MKKYRFLSVLLVFVMLLSLMTACQTVPTGETELASSTPSSSSITPPSSGVVPATSTPATSIPVTEPSTAAEDGLAFVYYGPQFVVLSPDWRPSEALVNHLYWVVKSTKECILICDEPIYSSSYTTTNTHVYFVKEAEPTKIYRAPIGDFTNHQLFYESAYGEVTYMTGLFYYSTGVENYLQFVADEKKFVMLDMRTLESKVLMEQYYIDNAYIEVARDGVTWNNWIWFEGKPTENDPPHKQYFYYLDTGETEEDTTL